MGKDFCFHYQMYVNEGNLHLFELYSRNMHHTCSKHDPESLYSCVQAASRSHMPSHKPATGPTGTSTFCHGWLPVAPHKLSILNLFYRLASGNL
ncbi:hypothetical protein B0H34DRAFT_479409 [Crassisporium funariophilum]|nr:hypothetical protein B0H34DRAFT_479409 [Crassisporium funariophilum]